MDLPQVKRTGPLAWIHPTQLYVSKIKPHFLKASCAAKGHQKVFGSSQT